MCTVQVYSDRLEESQGSMAELRHKIAGDVVDTAKSTLHNIMHSLYSTSQVMLSHLAMKLYYVKLDTEQLAAEDSNLTR